VKKNELSLSSLPKTWVIDIDGTILKHNGYLCGEDEAIDCSIEFIKKIPTADKIILLTSRNKQYEDITLRSLKKFGIRYDAIIYDLPYGERILINDKKPSGLLTSIALNTKRDEGIRVDVKIDKNL